MRTSGEDVLNPLFVVLFLCVYNGVIFAKPPLPEGETDPVMLGLDPYLIRSLRGHDCEGRWGKAGSMVELEKDVDFQ